MSERMIRFVYICNQYGLFRNQIPEIPQHFDDEAAKERFNSEFESQPEYNLELVCGMTSNLPQLSTMRMFSNGKCKVYLVGGTTWEAPLEFCRGKIHTFDPCNYSKEQVFPLETLPTSNPTGEMPYESLAEPLIFPTNNNIYIFSFFQHFTLSKPIISFQSFDPNKRSFQSLSKPDISSPNLQKFFATHFIVSDYIYLFTRQSADLRFNRTKPNWIHSAFSFNTKTPPSQAEWKTLESLTSQFLDKNIPIPYEHTGDTGVSIVFPPNFRILIALYDYKPTAYYVIVDETGDSLQPIRHRPLIDPSSVLFNKTGCSRMFDRSHLLNLGDDRFCAIYSTRHAPLLIYIFKMDFNAEYENWQKSSLGQPLEQSVTVLCFKEINYSNIEVFRAHNLSACLAFVPESRRPLPSHVVPIGPLYKSDQGKPRVVYTMDNKMKDEYVDEPVSD